VLFVYAWKDGAVTLENKFELAKAKATDGTGTSYPAGLAFSPNGKFVYVAENVGDRLAVVNAATGEITQRFSTDHYPYGVALVAGGQVFVSAWGGSTLSQFRVLGDGTLAYLGRIEVGRHPSALAVKGTTLYVTLAGSDRVAVVDTKLRKVARYLHDAAPGAPSEGSTPNAVALTSDAKRLLVAEADNNAVAVFDVATGKLLGRVPTDWYPTAVAERQWRTVGPFRQRPRHPRQPRRPGSTHQLAEWEPNRVYARAAERQPASAAVRDDRDATCGVHRNASSPPITGSNASRRGAILPSATSSTSSKRIAPTIRSWAT
jgi:DNA-binding beta-propeller fold protein YncE